MLVTLPEETPVNELVDTAFSLEDRVGVSLGPVVVNGLYPELAGPRRRPGDAAAEAGRDACGRARPRRWRAAAGSAATAWQLQAEQVARLAEQLPLPQLRLPFVFTRRARPGRARPRWPTACSTERRRARGAGVTRADRARRCARSSAERRILVCSGSGGVGKTTTAAVLALEAARAGPAGGASSPSTRPSAWPTPSGLEGLTNDARAASRATGPGELWALMLDTKSTFDDLSTKHAETPEQAERILDNRFYRNISGALSGTQEYMAMEKLYELHESTDFDLVVVDTPPTRNALDFLDAPRPADPVPRPPPLPDDHGARPGAS